MEKCCSALSIRLRMSLYMAVFVFKGNENTWPKGKSTLANVQSCPSMEKGPLTQDGDVVDILL